MKTYKINNKRYYLVNDIQTENPSIFKGCNNGRTFAKKHVPMNKQLFAKLISGIWIVSDGKSLKFDKLFVLKDWFNKTYVDEQEKDKEPMDPLPEIIVLEDNEKFVDNDGNIVDIIVRGKRTHEGSYFRVKCIMKGFDINRLNDTITDTRRNGYIEGTHYKFFYYDVPGIAGTNKNKELYLTYTGFLRVLFASRNQTTDKFVSWASKTLFTAQLGTPKQKRVLASKLLGVSPKAVKEVFNKTAYTLPCIYLFSVGLVKDLRKTLNIDASYNDDLYVYKWGMTIDLERRTGEHEVTYGKLKGSQLELVLFGLIDQQYISNAETKVKNLFHGMDSVLEHEKYEELAVLPKTKLKFIKEQYELISSKYRGHIGDLTHKLAEKDNEIKLVQERCLKEIAMKNTELAMKDIELLRKDLEIANLKLTIKTGKK